MKWITNIIIKIVLKIIINSIDYITDPFNENTIWKYFFLRKEQISRKAYPFLIAMILHRLLSNPVQLPCTKLLWRYISFMVYVGPRWIKAPSNVSTWPLFVTRSTTTSRCNFRSRRWHVWGCPTIFWIILDIIWDVKYE